MTTARPFPRRAGVTRPPRSAPNSGLVYSPESDAEGEGGRGPLGMIRYLILLTSVSILISIA
jgi:hypothetical protein